MYPRRLLLDDARRHGVPILPLDVNRSEPEYVAEETGEGTADGAIGIRLGLQDVHGISTPRSARSWRRGPSAPFRDVGRLPAAHHRVRARWSRRSRTPARSTRCPAAATADHLFDGR